MIRRTAKSLLCLAALSANAGCYAYLPVSTQHQTPGTEVQLSLTDSGTVVLAPAVGPSVGVVTGRFVGDSADTYLLNVTQTARRDGVETDWRGERVVVPRAVVTGVAVRRFSAGRTVLFSAIATGALVGIAEAFAGGGGASAPGGTPGGPGTGK